MMTDQPMSEDYAIPEEPIDQVRKRIEILALKCGVRVEWPTDAFIMPNVPPHEDDGE